MACSPSPVSGERRPGSPVACVAALLLIAGLPALASCSSQQPHENVPAVIRDVALNADGVVALVSDRDLDPEMVSYLATQHSIAHPSWVSADLDADGRADYAILAMSSVDDQCEVALVVVLHRIGGTPTVLPVVRLASPCARPAAKARRVDIYLRRLEAGTPVAEAEAVASTGSMALVTLTADGVEVVYFERSAQAFFLDGGRLRGIWTAD